MSAAEYELPPLEVTIARAYRDRIGRDCAHLVFDSHLAVCCKGDWHYNDEFHALMLDAKRQGVVSQEEWHEFWEVHTVSRGEHWQDGSVAYATVDIAVIVEDTTISTTQTTERAYCGGLPGKRTIPTIIGAFHQRRILAGGLPRAGRKP